MKKTIANMCGAIAVLAPIASIAPIISSCSNTPIINKYNVTFDSMGGSNVASQTVEEGGTIVEPKSPTKNNNVFSGGYTDTQGVNLFDFSTKIKADTILYAKGTAESKKIDDSQTVKVVDIQSQQETSISYIFKTDSELTETYLTAVAQVDSDSTISITPKVYVSIDSKTITAKVEFDASAVTKMNENVTFHITFLNSDPNDTWAQTISGLNIKYATPFFDSLFEYTGYLFAGSSAEQTNYRIGKIAIDESVDLDSVQIKDFKTTTGNIVFGTPEIGKNTTHSIYVCAPYTSFSAEVGDTIGISLTLSCTLNNTTFEQTYTMGLLAVQELYLIDNKLSVTNGGDFAWCYGYMGLPLGDQETVNDVTVKITQTQGSGEPMYLEIYAKQLDYENNYFSVIFNIKEGYIDPVNIPKVKFTVEITKPDTRASLGAAHGSAAGNQTFKDIELSYDTTNGEYLIAQEWETPEEPGELTKGKEFGLSQYGKRSKSTISVDQFDGEVSATLQEDSLPEGFTPTTKDGSSFATLQEIDSTSPRDIMVIYTSASSGPSEGQAWIDQYGGLTCKGTVTFTAKRQITTSIGLQRYQKQIFSVKDFLGITFK